MRKSASGSDDSSLPFQNQQPQTCRLVNVRHIIVKLIDEFCNPLTQQGITTAVDVPGSINVAADAELLRLALKDLCLDAINNMSGGGELVITAYTDACGIDVEIADSRSAQVSKTDQALLPTGTRTLNGPTSEKVAGATRFAAMHGGFLSVRNCPEGGIAFTLHLPSSIAVQSAA